MGLGKSRINFRDLWNKTKYYQGAEDFFFRDLGRSMHYFKGAREHRPPGEGLNNRSYNHEQDKFDEFISPDEGLLRETCKSQNINPILFNPLSSPSVLFRS